MNDALITRVTGENGQMRLEEIERQGLFCSGWMIAASGSAITRCLATSCASAASGNWRLSCRKSTVPLQKLDGPRGFPSEAIHHALAAGDALMLRYSA